MVGPMVAAKLSGVVGAILVFIVVFSALASSLDSLLAATADLITQDIYRGHLRPDARESELRKAARMIILLLGVGTWLLCLPRLTTLAELLYFTGAFVASTIWPIAAGSVLATHQFLRRYPGHAAGNRCRALYLFRHRLLRRSTGRRRRFHADRDSEHCAVAGEL